LPLFSLGKLSEKRQKWAIGRSKPDQSFSHAHQKLLIRTSFNLWIRSVPTLIAQFSLPFRSFGPFLSHGTGADPRHRTSAAVCKQGFRAKGRSFGMRWLGLRSRSWTCRAKQYPFEEVFSRHRPERVRTKRYISASTTGMPWTRPRCRR
jgi:hypothetical protein